ncbi:MAG: type II toxin-antitoxin system VapC family toxin [Flavobacteriales bacterium]|jgi:PIN domain nuclease of toxin-antitoxin system|nr:type II toxin-antitoxin system VapC family toxin [Flavobacteriales bacterium]
MSVLLDTHVLLWFQSLDRRLAPSVRDQIERSPEAHFVSHVSFWEIAIKSSIGKLRLDQGLATTFKLIGDAGFLTTPIKEEHFLAVASLPLHHRDPFDRPAVAG